MASTSSISPSSLSSQIDPLQPQPTSSDQTFYYRPTPLDDNSLRISIDYYGTLNRLRNRVVILNMSETDGQYMTSYIDQSKLIIDRTVDRMMKQGCKDVAIARKICDMTHQLVINHADLERRLGYGNQRKIESDKLTGTDKNLDSLSMPSRSTAENLFFTTSAIGIGLVGISKVDKVIDVKVKLAELKHIHAKQAVENATTLEDCKKAATNLAEKEVALSKTKSSTHALLAE